MRFTKSIHLSAALAAALVLFACTNNMEPAQQALSRADSAVTAAAPDAGKYMPDQMNSLQGRLADLKRSFASKDYDTVLSGAPTLERDANDLAQSAAAQKQQVAQALEARWADFASSMPKMEDTVKARVDELSKKGKRPPKDVDLASAKSNLSDAETLWLQAQGSHTSGDVAKALGSARDAKSKFEAAAAALKLDLPAPPASGQ
jgi:hypothetical protein